MEIDAHNQLLKYARKNKWEQKYIDELEQNRASWLKDKSKYEKDMNFRKKFDEEHGGEFRSRDGHIDALKLAQEEKKLIQRFDDLRLTNLKHEFNLLDAISREKFVNDFGSSGDNVLRSLNGDTDLINSWKKVAYLMSESNDLDFLKALKKVEADDVWKHIEGEVYSTSSAAGGHILTNQRKVFINGEVWIYSDKIRFKVSNITKPTSWAEGMEILEAKKIEISNGTQWVPKNLPGKSSFFPSSWSKQKILEEVALAYKKAKANPSSYKGGNTYEVFASDGTTKIRFFYGNQTETNPLFNGTSNPVIRSSFPIY